MGSMAMVLGRAEDRLADGVVEDGTRGIVYFKFEMEDGGPASLVRGERSERLFSGRWVHVDRAEAYAREHGHEFECG